ncbi:hypothetical protein BgAZ_105900 [Babesia gibsoni]|uniref:Uncharacterized protein n=1 Tax=Babesia gibsoni TaxID=33632 RepID=A0AAD8PG05_BABGI|nr:hypothetical protein BgAZ_105900 [Babesia gibsoni]
MIDLNVPWTNTKDGLLLLKSLKAQGWSTLGANVYCQCDKDGILDIKINLPSSHEDRSASDSDSYCNTFSTTLGRYHPNGPTLIRRITIVLHDGFQPNSVSKIADSRDYDIIAVMPTTQKTFQAACDTVNCDLINLDYYCHCIPFKIKRGMVMAALNRGCYFEVTMSTLDHLSDMGFEGKAVGKAFRSNFCGILNYIPLKRLVLSPGNNSVHKVLRPDTFIAVCNELVSNAIGAPSETVQCITMAPRGCISKGAARQTYGTGILVHKTGEALGNKFSTLTTL